MSIVDFLIKYDYVNLIRWIVDVKYVIGLKVGCCENFVKIGGL